MTIQSLEATGCTFCSETWQGSGRGVAGCLTHHWLCMGNLSGYCFHLGAKDMSTYTSFAQSSAEGLFSADLFGDVH